MTQLRFGFGKNWQAFLGAVNDERVAAAECSLKKSIAEECLTGKRFLDIGSGSGIHSLAATRLGAVVTSFDYDADSVACAQSLKQRFAPEAATWTIQRGSALDAGYLRSLGTFDLVYSWGVLHHTGNMKQAFENVAPLVCPGGKLCLSIYNDQGYMSRVWWRIKWVYNQAPRWLKPAIVILAGIYLWLPTFMIELCQFKLGRKWREYAANRGMSPWIDVVDWVGGFPFEVARPEDILIFFRPRGFELIGLTTQRGNHGCNEYLFVKAE